MAVPVRLVAAIALVSLILGLSALAATAPVAGCSLTYRVRLVPEAEGRVEIFLEGLRSAEVTFSMIDPIARRIDCSQGVSDVKAVGPDGGELPITRVYAGWRVSTRGHRSLTFEYSFSPALQGDVGDVWHGVWLRRVAQSGAFFVNGAVFAFPDLVVTEARVIYDVPAGWTAGTSFIPEGPDNPNTFRVEGVPDLATDLTNNVTRFGIAEEVVAKAYDGIEISFIAYRPPEGGGDFWYPHYGNTRREQMEEYIDLIGQSIGFFRAIFGFWPGPSRYWVSTPAVGNEMHTAHWRYWMQAWPREQYSQVPHHVLHAWIFWDSTGFRLLEDEWWWIMEGVPVFYESELASALTGDDKWLGITYAHYLVVKRAVQFGLLDKNTVNHYALSHLRALAVDRAIRQHSGQRRSLDDLLGVIGRRFALHRHFHRRDLVDAISEAAGADLTGFYLRYLAGRVSAELPPVDGFIEEYREPFLRWLEDFREHGQPRPKTLVLVALEMGLHSPGHLETEHSIVGGSHLPGLDRLAEHLRQCARPLTEQNVIAVLSQLTGVDQSDFFEFYTIGDYRPSVEEIENWLHPTPPGADPGVATTSPARPAAGLGRRLPGGVATVLVALAILPFLAWGWRRARGL